MRVLVACEFSGRVREAFKAKGHDATSCDLIDTEIPGSHYKGDVRDLLQESWDLMICHPPCRYLACSGARWWKARQVEQQAALDFVQLLLDAPIDKICLENPIGKISTSISKPTQIIHPWQFGHGEKKSTCLWLKNLPSLEPTNIVDGRSTRILNMPDSLGRKRARSLTYEGIAKAMADQW